MSDIELDIAEVRSALVYGDDRKGLDSLDRIEAEVERLREEVRLWQSNYPKDLTARLLKYEAEVERLRKENDILKEMLYEWVTSAEVAHALGEEEA